MALPISTYYTRIDAMIKEALSDYRSNPDRTSANAGAKNYSIRLVSMTDNDDGIKTHVTFIFSWEIILVHGATDLGNKGVMRVWMYEDIADLKDYFDNHHNFVLDTQTLADNYIAGFRTGTLKLSFNDEGDIGKARATRWTLRYSHDVFYNNRQV